MKYSSHKETRSVSETKDERARFKCPSGSSLMNNRDSANHNVSVRNSRSIGDTSGRISTAGGDRMPFCRLAVSRESINGRRCSQTLSARLLRRKARRLDTRARRESVRGISVSPLTRERLYDAVAGATPIKTAGGRISGSIAEEPAGAEEPKAGALTPKRLTISP